MYRHERNRANMGELDEDRVSHLLEYDAAATEVLLLSTKHSAPWYPLLVFPGRILYSIERFMKEDFLEQVCGMVVDITPVRDGYNARRGWI